MTPVFWKTTRGDLVFAGKWAPHAELLGSSLVCAGNYSGHAIGVDVDGIAVPSAASNTFPEALLGNRTTPFTGAGVKNLDLSSARQLVSREIKLKTKRACA